MHKELKKLVESAEAQGFEALVLKSGHVVFLYGGVKVTTFAGTPSDYRSWRNSMAYMKRAGYVDPKARHRKRKR